MSSFTDQTGNTIELSETPKRIVSLVPSQTELLYELGLDEAVAGITKFCVRPACWFKNKIKAGGTKNVNIDIVNQLQPDLIIANKEENVKEQIEELKQNYPVWVSDVNTLETALQMIISIGEITRTYNKANLMVRRIESGFSHIPSRLSTVNSLVSQAGSKLSTAYLIWRNPYMAAGGDTFIHAMMELCGFQNIYSAIGRYPILYISDLQTADCQLLLLSSEPYPFKQTHLDELQQQLPNTKIHLVDGEMFSWYGSRLLYAPAYFESLWQQINNNQSIV